uniref:Bifunctional lysine-specific demethylase and histidyl-hydroxylase n=1 Tax=Cacopsylla melanoneura TaxID=428564 RepID=A0A8D8YL82_9HEMI
MAPVAAATVYSKLFANRTETDPFKKPKTKIRKGKHFKKEMKKIRKIKKQKRVLNSRLKNEGVLLKNLKETFPGISNFEKGASEVKTVFDPNGQTIDQAKIDRIIKKLMSKKDVLLEKLTPTKNKSKSDTSSISPKVNTTSAKTKKKGTDKSKSVKAEETSKSDKQLKQPSKGNKRSTVEMSASSKGDNQPSKGNKRSTVETSSSSKIIAKPKNNSNETPQSAKKIKLSEESSEEQGRKQFQWILGNTSVDSFFKNHWEKKVLHIARKEKTYYNNLITSVLIDEILRDNFIEYTKNIDITSYVDGQRETLNPEGRALPQVVWDYYQNGCSVRFLNPQTYIKPLQQLNASLQELFGSFVGANTYLTPANSQGFAPHYDDIEAFILQLEGRKAWKVYAPRTDPEQLPRYSSPNFTQEEIGRPILEVILEPGDLLYLPRGFIHQASTVPSHHSLHVTISVYQKTAWVDLLEKALPKALQAVASADVEFRRGLPIGYLKQAGLSPAGAGKPAERKTMEKTLRSLVTKLAEFVSLDEGVDEMGKQAMHDALPPVLSDDELQCTVFGNGMRISAGTGQVINRTDLGHDTKVRLVRANACRLVEELSEEYKLELHLYYTIDNSLEYRGKEPQFLIMPAGARPLIRALFESYPRYASVASLIRRVEDKEEGAQVTRDLWERGLLVTSAPLRPLPE